MPDNIRVAFVRIALVALSLCMFATVAYADEARRVIVLPLEGPHADDAQQAIEGALAEAGYEVVARNELERAVASSGAAADSVEVAMRVGAVVVVGGRIEAGRRRARAFLRIIDARTGRTLAEPRFEGRTARQLIGALERGGRRISAAMSLADSPRVAVTDEPTAEGPTERARTEDIEAPPPVDGEPMAEPSVDGQPSEAGPHMLVLSVGGGVQSRELGYRDDLFAQLVGYTLPAAPWLHARARWYPGAHFTRDVLAHIGISAEFGSIVGVRSRQREGSSFPTDSWRFEVGADVRIPIHPVELGLGLSYGMHTFALGRSEGGDSAPVPNVRYQYVRPALRGRLEIGAGFYLDAAFGWRFLTGIGALGTWFPRNTGSGLDVGAGCGWESDLGLGVRLGFEMQRYFFAFRPEPGDPIVAGGAADQFLAGTIDVVWRVR